MDKANKVFNNTYFATRILINSTKLRNYFEKEIEKLNEEDEQYIDYKRKLQYIYRIRNNAYSFLLLNNFQCAYSQQEDGNFFYMNIEGDVYDCKESSIKNSLGKRFDEIISNCLSKDELDKIIKEEEKVAEEIKIKESQEKIDNNQTSTTKKKKSNKQNDATPLSTDDIMDFFNDLSSVETSDTDDKDTKEPKDNKVDTSNDNLSNDEIVEELLKVLGNSSNNDENVEKIETVDITNTETKQTSNSTEAAAPIEEIVEPIEDTTTPTVKPVEEVVPPVEATNTNSEEIKEIIKEAVENSDKTKKIRCPRCFSALPSGTTICSFCNYNLNESHVISRDELNKLDDDEKIDIHDIEKLFNSENEDIVVVKEADEPVVEEVVDNKPEIVKEFTEVYTFDKTHSMPSIKKENLIVDVYTLKLKDPLDENEDEKQDDDEENLRRRRNDAEEEILKVLDEEESKNIPTREIKIYVYPLKVPESGNELSSEILVYITQDGNCGSFCSNTSGINTVKVNTNIHNFIVRGQYKNGEFQSKVLCNGKTLTDNCEVSRDVENIRPDTDEMMLGHPITYLNVEYNDGTETLIIHAVPLEQTNSYGDYTKTLFMMENVTQKNRKLYITKAESNINFEFENELYKATSMWIGDEYRMRIENY